MKKTIKSIIFKMLKANDSVKTSDVCKKLNCSAAVVEEARRAFHDKHTSELSKRLISMKWI